MGVQEPHFEKRGKYVFEQQFILNVNIHFSIRKNEQGLFNSIYDHDNERTKLIKKYFDF